MKASLFRILRLLRVTFFAFLFLTLGFLAAPRVQTQTIGVIVAYSYLSGCIEARVELTGKSGGENVLYCVPKARTVYQLFVNPKLKVELLKSPVI